MTRKRSNYLALLAATVFLATGLLAAQSQEPAPNPIYESTAQSIDFEQFLTLSAKTLTYRADRLVSLDAFQDMVHDENTIILDTRSAEAFAEGHIDGAINLTFADFTERKLADTIPGRDTRILIYCNNNFSDDVAPVLKKSPPLALNVPTFINLVGYGYENVYELGEQVSLEDRRLAWVTPAPAGVPLPEPAAP